MINTMERLSPAKRRQLEAIIGDFTEKRPKVDGKEIYIYARELVSTGRDMDTITRLVGDFLNKCRIPEELWHRDVVILHCVAVTAGIELALGAICDAVALKKGQNICHMQLGNVLLEEHDRPHPHKLPTAA